MAGPEDHEGASDALHAAKIAAVREAVEEVAMPALDPQSLVPFARWLPKFVVERRFDTWFFIARAPDVEWDLVCQPGEIIDATWIAIFAPSTYCLADSATTGASGACRIVWKSISTVKASAHRWSRSTVSP